MEIESVQIFIKILANTDESLRLMAVRVLALDKYKTLPDALILTLITILQDKNELIRSEAAQILSEQKKLPDAAIQALNTALQDNNSQVKAAAAHALSGHKTLPNYIVQELITALLDKNTQVRYRVIEALGQQEVLSEDAISALERAVLSDESFFAALPPVSRHIGVVRPNPRNVPRPIKFSITPI